MRRRTGLGLVVVLIAVGALAYRHSTAIDRREERRIDTVATDLFTAMGSVDQWHRFELERSTALCDGREPGLGADEGWYARKAHDLLAPRGPYDYLAMLAAGRDRLRAEGWDVRLLAGPVAGGLQELIAVRGDMTVNMLTPPLHLTITSGPCALSLVSTDPRMHPVPG